MMKDDLLVRLPGSDFQPGDFVQFPDGFVYNKIYNKQDIIVQDFVLVISNIPYTQVLGPCSRSASAPFKRRSITVLVSSFIMKKYGFQHLIIDIGHRVNEGYFNVLKRDEKGEGSRDQND